MELNTTIQLKEDFSVMCDLFLVDPTQIIQKFCDTISLPRLYSSLTYDDRLSSLFFLEYVQQNQSTDVNELKAHHIFMDKMKDQMIRLAGDTPEALSRMEQEGKKIMKEWHRHILNLRSEYLLNGLKDL